MAVMRSVFYVPGNNEKMVAKAPNSPRHHHPGPGGLRPPAEKAKAASASVKTEARRHRRIEVYSRINNWKP